MSTTPEIRAIEIDIWGKIEDIVKGRSDTDFMPEEAYNDEEEMRRFNIAFMNVKDRLEKLAGGDPSVGERALKERDRVLRMMGNRKA